MNKVVVRFDKSDGTGLIKLEGYTEDFPEVGRSFGIDVYKNLSKIIIDFGKVHNIRCYGDMYLLQTEFTVLEVLFIGDGSPFDSKNILNMARKPKRYPRDTVLAKEIKEALDSSSISQKRLKLLKQETT